MAQIVNLKGVRKARQRDEARRQADANAVKFGQTKAEKDLQKTQAAKATRDLDAHKRED